MITIIYHKGAGIIYTITEQLLALESEAQEAMNDIAKENAILTRKTQENLAKKISAIESDGAETIRRLVNEAETHTAARIALIQEEYHAKTEMLHNAGQNKNLRGKIFHDVLYGEI